MRIDLYEYETDEAGLGEAPAAAAETPADDAGAVEAPPAEETRTFTQEEYDNAVREAAWAAAEETHARLSAELQRFNPPVPGATPGPMSGQPPVLPEYDPFDPDSAQAYFEARDQQLLAKFAELMDAKVGPVAQTFEQQQEAARIQHGEEILNDMVADALASGDDLGEKAKEAVMPLAAVMFPQFADRYGPESPAAAEAAVYQAVNYIRDVVAEAKAAGATQQANQMAALAGSSSEPASAAGVVTNAVEGPQSPLSAAQLAAKWGSAGRGAAA